MDWWHQYCAWAYRHDAIAPAHNCIGVMVISTSICTTTHRNHPSWFGHLIIHLELRWNWYAISLNEWKKTITSSSSFRTMCMQDAKKLMTKKWKLRSVDQLGIRVKLKQPCAMLVPFCWSGYRPQSSRRTDEETHGKRFRTGPYRIGKLLLCTRRLKCYKLDSVLTAQRQHVPACIISTAQHAKPKVIGHKDPFRAQFETSSRADTTYSATIKHWKHVNFI